MWQGWEPNLVNKPDKVVLHCAATPDTEWSRFLIQDIRRWHMEDNGWSDIGYHWYLNRDGIWFPGRPENIRGAHAGKEGNDNSIGICYEGTWLPRPEQIKALFKKYKELKEKYSIGHDKWFGHYEFNSRKSCPGFSMDIHRIAFQCMDSDFRFLSETR